MAGYYSIAIPILVAQFFVAIQFVNNEGIFLKPGEQNAESKFEPPEIQ